MRESTRLPVQNSMQMMVKEMWPKTRKHFSEGLFVACDGNLALKRTMDDAILNGKENFVGRA